VNSTVRIHTDGAARGNPGPAAWAYIIECPGREPIEHAERLGEATNNFAEYTALLRALERSDDLDVRDIHVFSDSELMVKQMNGEYAVKNAELKQLHEQARALQKRFRSVKFEHVRREQNKRADALCNQVLDASRAPATTRKSNSPNRKNKANRRPDVDAIAIECLRTAAQSWGKSHGAKPAPELIWDQIWSVLEENGVLKPNR
jgi:ribonuclease HI